MCMPKAPDVPETPEPAAPPAPPPKTIDPELRSRARNKRSSASSGNKKFRSDYKKTSNTPSKTTASGLQINT